jgi:hypothetical protein
MHLWEKIVGQKFHVAANISPLGARLKLSSDVFLKSREIKICILVIFLLKLRLFLVLMSGISLVAEQ